MASISILDLPTQQDIERNQSIPSLGDVRRNETVILTFPLSSINFNIPLYVSSPFSSANCDFDDAPEQSHQTCSRMSRGIPDLILLVNFKDKVVKGEERLSLDWTDFRVREWWDFDSREVRQRQVTIKRSAGESFSSFAKSFVHF